MKLYKELKDGLKDSKDVVIKDTKRFILYYQEQLCNINLFNKDYYTKLSESKESCDSVVVGICKKYEDNDIYKLYQIIFQGLLVLYDKSYDALYIFDISQAPSRAVSDSTSEPESQFGSRDGFVENYKTNIGLIRTRLKSDNLEIKDFCIGRRSKTYVGLLSIKDIHNKEMKETIEKELNEIDIDAVLEMSDVMQAFQSKRKTPCYMYIGSPDLAVRHLLNGEFIIVIDRISNVVTFPVSFVSYTKTKIDSMNIKGYNFLERSLVILSLFISTIFLGLIASMMTFQKNSLSLIIALALAKSENGTIFPLYLQILFVLMLFELYTIIGFRSSKATLSQTVVLIGGILIGQNTIESKMVGVIIMTLTALAFLTTFIITSNVNMVMYISMTRFFLLISSIYFGIYGLTLGIIILFSSLYHEETFGIHFTHPFIPLDISDFNNFFYPTSTKKLKTRPNYNLTDRTMKK